MTNSEKTHSLNECSSIFQRARSPDSTLVTKNLRHEQGWFQQIARHSVQLFWPADDIFYHMVFLFTVCAVSKIVQQTAITVNHSLLCAPINKTFASFYLMAY